MEKLEVILMHFSAKVKFVASQVVVDCHLEVRLTGKDFS